jgi:outer membrane protein assembly factor BamB
VWTSPQLDGAVYAEPLGFARHVIAATESNSVYALDATTGDVAWRTNLGTPVASSSLPCGNIDPVSGITATPVIDASTGTVYVAAFLDPGRHELFALDSATGEVAWHRPIDPPRMNPLTQQLRSALLLANGRVYAAYGGLFGDCGVYHGWVAGVDADGGGSLIDYRAPTQNAGGIWAPSGPAVDGDGNVYVATGNSFTSGSFDLGNSVIKLSPELQQLSFFAPADWAELNAGDVDLGSVGPAVLSGGEIFQIGKGGTGYLLEGDDLGGIGGEIFSDELCASSFGGTAHTSTSIYVPCTDGLVAVTVAEDGRSFFERWRSASFDAGPPIVAGGIAWTVDLSVGALVGLEESNGDEVVRLALPSVSHFASPSSVDGCLFVPTLRTISAMCAEEASAK